MSSLEKTQEYRIGVDGEELILDILDHDGYAIIETRKASDGGAPLMRHIDGNQTLPDFLVHTGEGFVFVEVKTKEATEGQPNGYVHYRKLDQNRHGFDANNYDDYRVVRGLLGAPVLVVFYEVPNQQLRWEYLNNLSVVDETTDQQANRDYGGDHMVFFPRDMMAGIEACRFDGDSYVGGEAVETVSKTPILPLDSHERPQWSGIADGTSIQTDLKGQVIGQ